MLSTLVIIGGVFLALIGLLALIVKLSARPSDRGTTTASRTPGWVVDTGERHPDAWAPLSNTSTSIRATR